MKPTVGRQVHYRPTRADPTAHEFQGSTEDRRFAATVAYVDPNSGLLNLCVIDSAGDVFSRRSVKMSDDPAPGECGWPPVVKTDHEERVAEHTSKQK